MPVIERMSIRFEVTRGMVAAAMALEACDDMADPRAFVALMSKADARRAVRAALWAYGDRSWPDDYDPAAYNDAMGRVRVWWPDA